MSGVITVTIASAPLQLPQAHVACGPTRADDVPLHRIAAPGDPSSGSWPQRQPDPVTEPTESRESCSRKSIAHEQKLEPAYTR